MSIYEKENKKNTRISAFDLQKIIFKKNQSHSSIR